jgi:hypothetical protein
LSAADEVILYCENFENPQEAESYGNKFQNALLLDCLKKGIFIDTGKNNKTINHIVMGAIDGNSSIDELGKYPDNLSGDRRKEISLKIDGQHV